MGTQETKIVITAATAQAQAAVKSLEGSFRSMIGVVSGALSVGAFAGLVKSSIELQNELGGLSAKTGITAKDLAGLKFAADQNGASLELVAKAAKELSINMATSPEKFAKLGINATTATGALTQIADLVSTMPDGMQKTALLAELMGKKVGPEMVEFLNQGGAALQNYIAKGQDIYKVTDQSAASAKEFKDQMAELEARTSGFGVAVSNQLLPGLLETAKAMNELNESGHPVLALWRALAGMGKVPWDLLMPPENLEQSLSSANRLQELRSELADIENRLKETGGRGGLIGKWMYGTREEQLQQVEILKNQIAVLEKHGAELDKKSAGAATPKAVPKSVSALLAGDKTDPLSGLQILIALEQDYQSELSKRAEALNAPLLSASERALAEDMRGVSKRAQDARVDLEKLYSSGKVSAADYALRLREISEAEDSQTQSVKALAAAQDQLNSSWEYGAKVALRNYLDEAANTARQAERLFGNAFKGMEDGLVQFVQKGKLDFASLRDSIISDLIRIQIQKMEAGILGALFGMAGSGTPATAGTSYSLSSGGSSFGLQAPSYDGGGFTGYGPRSGGIDGKGGFWAVMHPQEKVSDLTKGGGGGGIVIAPVYNIQIDGSTDMVKNRQLMQAATRRANAELMDTLRRQGVL